MPRQLTLTTFQQRLQAIQKATAALAADVEAAMRREQALPPSRRHTDPYQHFRQAELTGRYKPTNLKKQTK